jgi:hypothetical protein
LHNIFNYFAQFLGKKCDAMGGIHPFNRKVEGSIFFSNYLFLPWTKYMKKYIIFEQLHEASL